MLGYILRRILGAIPTLLILATLTFFLLRLAPGGPFDSDQVWPPEIQENILHRYELDLPLITQYGHWLRDLLRGDFRQSFQYLDRPVSKIISEALPISFGLGSAALLISIMIGIPLGVWAAWRKDLFVDHVISLVALSGINFPSFLIASLLILVFSLQLGWLPPALLEGPSSFVLPLMTLSWRPLALVIRLVRNSMIDSLQSDYIRTASAKGLSTSTILFKHALKNSLIPVVTLFGPIAANLLTGSFIVEMIFQIPGLGRYFIQAVLNRDYPLVMGVTLTYGIVLILSNLFVDIIYHWIDPRIRLTSSL